MIYLKVFPKHTSYESEVNVGGEDFKIPNVSYCDDADDIHFNPYNLIEFYVGEISEPQTVIISTDLITFENVQVSKGNKWYNYLLPKGKEFCSINGSVNKVVVKADIKTTNNTIIPTSTVEASFKGSNTSKLTSTTIMFKNCTRLTSLNLSGWDMSNVTNMSDMFNGCYNLKSLTSSSFNTSKVTDMSQMFYNCRSLTSLDLSGLDTSKVTNIRQMFYNCLLLNTITMKSCSEATIKKIKDQLEADGITGVTIVTE